MKAQDFFIKLGKKLTWFEVGIMCFLFIGVWVHDTNQEPTYYVMCKDGTRQNVTPETHFVCDNIPVHYDNETGTYEIAMYARNSIIKDSLRKQVDENFKKYIENLTNEKKE